MNTKTLGRSIKEEREGLAAAIEASRDTQRFFGATRSMQQPNGDVEAELGDGGGARVQGRRKEEEEEKRRRGKRK